MAEENKSLTIFHYAGKNYIGYYVNPSLEEADKPSFTGITTTYDKHYIFLAPAELSYKINITADATADLVSTVMPLYPADFMNGSEDKIYFAFPKDQVVLSTIKEANIHSNIVAQYKQLTGIGE